VPKLDFTTVHEDEAYFRAAVSYTAAEIGFLDVLVEKDYFCSLALQLLASEPSALLFKGGTSLAKIHVGAYRISEDLDFSVSISETASRRERSRAVDGLRRGLERTVDATGLRLARPLQGSNESRQYSARLAYDSRLDGTVREIKLEVGAREPVLTPPIDGEVLTLLRDPIGAQHLFPKFRFPCLSWQETMAEKFRAAMTRVAIRDFFDIKFATRNMLLRPEEPEFLEILRRKLAIEGSAAVDLSEEKRKVLRRQLETDLRPVLRSADFGVFNLNETYARVQETASALG
jgi:predicted nucleotidyltransferase component of viral defense system